MSMLGFNLLLPVKLLVLQDKNKVNMIYSGFSYGENLKLLRFNGSLFKNQYKYANFKAIALKKPYIFTDF